MEKILITCALLLLISGCTQEISEENQTLENETLNLTVENETSIVTEEQLAEEYNPTIDPNDFISGVNNPYFTLTPGETFIYESETEDGLERIEVFTTNETRQVLGVTTIVVWDRVWLDGDLIEDTKDWYAQDSEGNVWYFGEETQELVAGQVVNTKGSWEAGVDGAKPGIIMKANPQINDSYRQEYYQGEAEDMADVLALGESVDVPFGSFTDCLKTSDWTPLDPGNVEHKYYCSEVGGVALEVVLEDNETVQLINITTGSMMEIPEEIPEEYVPSEISEEEAKNIALSEVSGEVTDIEIEEKYGKMVYVVEINGETDVAIDIETGEVLGVEN
ncbi:PepSY domain-containing protein [Candidatus Micrarchaeota archaeon]|nr:PepSY domain-containing protein [Candidatus Micrarchaeota archaeon]